MYWQRTLSRLSLPGLALLILGAVLCLRPAWALRLFPSQRREGLQTPVRLAGLAAALLGALIALDFIPGL
ncbi:MAG: hypothetical protein MR842_01675 [Clostridiales bacterium]|nr:hypothetical protein [Clostridiales bacterium]MDO4350805.1 hypothetical protein [Eubacteriales bacterium]MDY4008418.1 hypothetical protein [Candidatus Limiplasma sp.]